MTKPSAVQIGDWQLSWTLKKRTTHRDSDALLVKTVANGGVSVADVFNADPSINAQRATITIAAADGCSRSETKRCDCVWWIAYIDAAGKRERESSGSSRKGDAERLLLSKVGKIENYLPVVKYAERLTFNDAAQSLIDDLTTRGKRAKSLSVTKRRINKHLLPFFGGRRLAGITAADITKYVVYRREQGIVRKDVRVADVSNAEINRELQALRRIFNMAIQQGRLAMKPHISLLQESAPRSGFFDRAQVGAVMKNLPEPLQAVVEFAFITGWRLYSEVLVLEWSEVDFAAGEVKLRAGRTKNGEPRTFPMTADLRALLVERQAEHDRVKKLGHITPLVFFRMIAKGRGGEKYPKPIHAFMKAWRNAVTAVGLPGRIPHDLRRSAIRTFTRAGLSEHIAMKLSGHLTPSVFRRYDIVSNDDLVNAKNALDAASGTTIKAASQA